MGASVGETMRARELRNLGTLYEEARAHTTALVEDLEDPHSIALPACPEWSVHDVVSHMTGACVDITERKLAEMKISDARLEIGQLNADLEKRVAQRTAATTASTGSSARSRSRGSTA